MSNIMEAAVIKLPDNLQAKLGILEDKKLVPSNSDIYLDLGQDLFLNLDKTFGIHSTVPYMNALIERIITEIFGSREITIKSPKYRLIKNKKEVELSIIGLLNQKKVELFFGKQTTLQYKLPKGFNFSNLTNTLPVISDLKLKSPDLILTDRGYSFTHPKLGCINLNKGFNFIGDIKFNDFHPSLGGFIHKSLGISSCTAIISFNPVGQVNLLGNIAGDIQLFCQKQFKATFNNLLVGLNIGSNFKPNLGLTGNLILQGYDPSQKNEPPLLLSGNLSLEPESLTAFFSQKSEKSWCNPYGLVGTELRNVRFQGGGTYLPPYFDNFGFIGDLKWQQTDLEVAFLMDTNDPQKLALILNPRQAVNLIQLWRGPVTAFISKQVGYSIDLINKAIGFLDKLMNLSIEPLDGDDDGELNSLIKYVPFPTTIAGQQITEGLEINGKVNAWGHAAILILHSDKDFKNISGLLKVSEIDLGFIKIKGADDETLDLVLKVTPTEQYLQGDGYVEIFDNEIANVEFKITSSSATFKNFDINLANIVSIDIDALNLDRESGNGSGYGKISVLGNTLAGITFDVNKTSVNLKDVQLNLLGFLSLNVPSLIVDLPAKSATGTASITAFNQSLGCGTLSFNSQNIAIKNSAINLGSLLNLNVPDFQLDAPNKQLFGVGDMIILGKQFSALGIRLNANGFQAYSNLNFGILAFNGATVTLGKGTNGKLNNSASIAGNLKFFGYTFVNLIASVNSQILTTSGSFNLAGIFLLKGVNNQRDATIMMNNVDSCVTIKGKFYLLGQELTALNIDNDMRMLKILGVKII
ncbi:hypothetical protein [Nostoc sp. FACHB-110]|uniref:hypothetical protein n=1 Tax=Nostoc sp. FACHB-110 TaxID=2692834 RepID=UPI001685E6B4|nr:hypothetical protein [Nostoc sp. FACHB-110]MBD2439580.1 hypothetical protein [Nostoc sp. FACHB-110]